MSVALVAGAVAFTLRPSLVTVRADARVPLHPILQMGALALAAGAVLWFARAGHTLLGDGSAIVVDLPRGTQFHPRLPLTIYAEYRWYSAVHDWFRGSPAEVVQQSVALGNVLFGVLFAAAALALSRLLWGAGHAVLALLSAGVLLAQGYMQLFAGYVEHHAVYALCITLYLLMSLLFLERRWPLWPAALALVLMLASDISGVIFAPSFVVLVILGLHARRTAAVVTGFAVLAVALVGLSLVLSALFPGFGLPAGVADLYDTATLDARRGGGLSYLVSPLHLRDFLNNQHLIGPLGGLFLLAALVPLLHRGARTPATLFLAAAGLTCLAASFATMELRLGYARDWDVFAPPGVVYTLAALAVMAACVPRDRAAPVLAAALLLSLSHTVAWVGLNHAAEPSRERFAHLPPGLSRNDVVLGNRFLRSGEFENAEVCFLRAISTNPESDNAHYLLSVARAAMDRLDEAGDALERAVALRPDRIDYRTTAAEIHIRRGDPDRASGHLAEVCRRTPERTEVWLGLARAMSQAGRETAADSALADGVAYFLEASRRNERDVRSLESAGRLEVARHRLDAALVHFTAALHRNPDTEGGLIWAGSLLMQLGRPEEARVYVDDFLDRYPDHEAAAGMRAWFVPAAGVEFDSVRR